MREIILKKYLLCFSLLPLIAGCQTNFVAVGPYEKLNKSLVYKLNNSIDTDKTIEKTSAAINAKKKIVGEYRVENKWTAFISADVEKINIHINADGAVIADLYAPEQQKPFYGIQANNCLSKTYFPKFYQKIRLKYEDMIKQEKRFVDYHGLGPNAIKCGVIKDNFYVIEVMEVQQGDQQRLYETKGVAPWPKEFYFTAPKDGYLIRLKDKRHKDQSATHFHGIAVFAVKQ